MDIHFPMLYRTFFIISFLRSLSNTPAIGIAFALLFSSVPNNYYFGFYIGLFSELIFF